MREELSAENLLVRIAQQNTAALEEIYDRYSPRVYGLISQILPLRSEAEGLIEEVFLQLWSESSRLCQEGASVAAWLVVTARTEALRRRRAVDQELSRTTSPAPVTNSSGGSGKGGTLPRRSVKSSKVRAGNRQPENGDSERSTNPGAPAWLPQPAEIALIDDRLVLLQKAINKLPKSQREALDLAVFRGCDESEIARALGEPLGKAQRSLRAAVTFVKHRRRAVCGTWAANI